MTTIMHEWLSETVNTLKKAGMIKDKETVPNFV